MHSRHRGKRSANPVRMSFLQLTHRPAA
jgi:hypothetical protein